MAQLRTIVPSPPSQQLEDDCPSSSSSTSPMKAKSPGSKETRGGRDGGGGAGTTTVMCVDELVMGRGRADTGFHIVRPRAAAATAVGRRKGNAGPGKLSRPRLPMSGYNLFLRDERQRRNHHTSPEGGSVGRAAAADVKDEINARWRQLDRQTRDSYNKRGRDEMARYKDEMELYNRLAVHRDGDEDHEDGRREPKKARRQTAGGTGKGLATHSAFRFVSTAAGGAVGDDDAELTLASYASLAERAEENERRIRENEATLAALARKEDFVVFLRILTKHLRLVDPDLYARARRVVRDCVEAHRGEYGGGAKDLGDRHPPDSATLSLSVYDMADKLRDAVGPKHFARAEALANAFIYHRGSQ